VNWFSSTFDHVVSDGEHWLGGVADKTAHEAGGVLTSVGLGQAGGWIDHLGDEAAGALDPELQLGQTDDPAQLIHGSPGAIAQSARRLTTFADAFATTYAGLNGIDTSGWTGAAADEFRVRYAPEPKKWLNATVACGDTGDVLGAYAQVVAWAQGQAKEAIAVYADGQNATAAAVAAYNNQVAVDNAQVQAYNTQAGAGQDPGPVPLRPAPFSDPGGPLRDHAQEILSAARSARNQAGAAAAKVTRQMADLAPAEPGLWAQLGDDGSDALQQAELADESFAAGVLTGTAGIVKLARTLNPCDPWNITHPAEFVAGESATLAGLVHVAVHPDDLVTSLFSGSATDPAEWAGKLVPQIALTLATAGGGTAADAAADATDAAALAGDATADAGAAGAPVVPAGQPPVIRVGDLNIRADPLDFPLPGKPLLPAYEGENITYLSDTQRAAFQLTVRDGRLYDAAGNLFDTSGGATVFESGNGRAIFVVDQDGNIYASTEQSIGVFHHSSFLAGGDVAGGGEIEVSDGEIRLLTNRSGHYFPTQEMTLRVLQILKSQGADVEWVQLWG
jgi:hypothetical protein